MPWIGANGDREALLSNDNPSVNAEEKLQRLICQNDGLAALDVALDLGYY